MWKGPVEELEGTNRRANEKFEAVFRLRCPGAQSLGEPLHPDVPPFNLANQTVALQAQQFGYSCDFLAYFDGSRLLKQSGCCEDRSHLGLLSVRRHGWGDQGKAGDGHIRPFQTSSFYLHLTSS